MPDDPMPSPVEAMRRAFDQSFAAPPARDTQEYEGFLAVRIGDGRFAMRISEVAALEARKKVVPLPVDKPALLGIAAIRGQLVPVYSLALLLGYRESSEDTHWLVLVGKEYPIGFASGGFEGYLRVARDDIRSLAVPREYTKETVQFAGAVRHILAIPSILQAIGAGVTASPGSD